MNHPNVYGTCLPEATIYHLAGLNDYLVGFQIDSLPVNHFCQNSGGMKPGIRF